MFAQKKILVVEDNVINRQMLSAILEERYQVLEAENGAEALEVLEEHHKTISLILLDIMMPVMDGYTFLDIIKKDPVYFSIPVIVTTQSDNEEDEVTALSHGAADFVLKPYKPKIILHRVASIIHLRETAAMMNQLQSDSVTGLYSKHYFYQTVRDAMSCNPNQDYDIICSDVDNFKLINDIFGVAAGDRLLCEIGGLFKEFVGESGLCGRLDADQFACLLEHRTGYADESFAALEAKVRSLPNAKNVSMRWGIYCIEDRNVSVEQMCDRALWAARSIKGRYGKHMAFYDDKLRGKMLHQQAIVDSMEEALLEGQFLVYLQPKYRIKDDRLAGAEALIRWNHPEWGFQSPAEFIPLFEKNGFITQLDRFVWERTCSLLKEWDKRGFPPLPVSVNVSRADIYNADIADILMEIVKNYELQPSRLHLEITESAYTENPDQIIEVVSHLRKQGFIIEMDDFGSGYSSLNMLNQMPIDILKLDMKFIQSETAKPVNCGILQFIIDLARQMNLSVVAEGVETKEQLERLMETGCDYVQGYYFARPMPASEFEELLQRQEAVDMSGLLEETVEHRSLQRPLLLVVDEDSRHKEQIWDSFSGHYDIVDGSEPGTAFSVIDKYKNRIEAVILSLGHPEGFGLLAYIKENKDSWDIPVVAAGPLDEKLEEKALTGGASDYAVKPHTGLSLWKRVRHAVRLDSFKRREQYLRAGAHQDPLTGVLNRRGLKAAMELLRKDGAPFALCFFDIDDLKAFNRAYGHIKGDCVIAELSRILRSQMQKDDIVARFGGDEFILVMSRVPSEEAVRERCEAVCLAFQEACSDGGRVTTVSVGIVFWDVTEPIMGAIERADKALCETRQRLEG